MTNPLDDFQKEMHDFVKPMLALLVYSNIMDGKIRRDVGTGFFYARSGSTFLISCEHVITHFLSARQGVIFAAVNAARYDKKDVGSWKCLPPPHDIGYLRFKEGTKVSAFNCATDREMNSAPVDWRAEAAFLAGFPGNLMELESTDLLNEKLSVTHFSTVSQYSKQHGDGVREQFEYPKDGDSFIEGANTVPAPGGMSGAPIWCFQNKPPQKPLYHEARIVAVENSWVPSQHLYNGTPIGHVLDLISANEFTHGT